MATKNFAIKLDNQSSQTGDITFEELAKEDKAATFQLTHSASGEESKLDLITKKNGVETSHSFTVSYSGQAATGESNLTTSDLGTVYNDAFGGDWDYVKATWTVGAVDQGGDSNLLMLRGGGTYDFTRWPPN